MNNFVFHNPVKVIFGSGSISQLGKEVSAWGDSALLVTGKCAIKRNGVYQQVADSLNRAGITFLEHDGVSANPLLSHVRAGIEKARTADCSVILGVGGGSVIDTAKAIGAGIPAAHDVWKYFTGKKSVQSTVPVICVPTVAGAGSEMNSGMVLTHDEKRYKFGFAHRYLFPKVCIADPAATLSLSAAQTAYGAIDTITHCLEAYFTSALDNGPFQYGFMETIFNTVIETSLRLVHHPDLLEDRSTMLWTGCLALSGIATAGLGKISFPMHLIEHALSARLDVPHGAGLAAVIPGFSLYQQNLLQPRLARLGRKVFGLAGHDEKQVASEAIGSLQQFIASLGCPNSLKDLGVSRKDFQQLTDHCLVQAQIWRMREYDRAKISSVLDYCYNP